MTLVVAGLLVLSPQAHAAHWELSFHADGTSKNGTSFDEAWADWVANQSGYDNTTKRTYSNFFSTLALEGAQGTAGSPAEWGPTSILCKGSLTFYLTWVQDEWDETPVPTPEMVVLNITGAVKAQALNKTSQSTAEAKLGKKDGTEVISTVPTGQVRRLNQVLDYVNGQSALRIPLVVPSGASEVQFTLPLFSKASTPTRTADSISDPDSDPTPTSFGSIDITGQPTTVGVAISSDIEQSWFKWDKHDPAELPDAYKLRNSVTHQLTDAPDPAKAQRVAGQLTPNDLSDDVWRLACLRDADGSMTVESAAQWLESPSVSFKEWVGGALFTANAEGFAPNATYVWTDPPQSTNNNAAFNSPHIDHLLASPPTATSPFRGIHLGNQKDGTGMTRTSTVSVTVADSTTSLSDSYTVNWHLPVENRHPIWNGSGAILNLYSDGTWIAPEIEQLTSPSGDSAIALGNAFGDYTDLTKEVRFNYGQAAFLTGSAVTAVGGIYVILSGGSALPIVSLLAAGLAATGTVIGSTVPIPTQRPDTSISNYNAYKAALTAQSSLGNYTFGHYSPRFFGDAPLAMASKLNDSDTYYKDVLQPDGTTQRVTDTIGARVRVSGYVVFDQCARKMQWDEYDSQGYTGPNDIHEVTRLNPKFEITFTDPFYTGGTGQ